jgi:hypothetical protein
MSAINGDKARFHRRRKNKIRRRVQQQVLYGSVTKPAAAPKATKSKEQA